MKITVKITEDRDVLAVNHWNGAIKPLTSDIERGQNLADVDNVHLRKLAPSGGIELTFDSPPCFMHSRPRVSAV